MWRSVVAVMAFARVVHAQPAVPVQAPASPQPPAQTPAPPTTPPPTAPPPTAPTVEPRDAAWTEYDDAFDRAARGDVPSATLQLGEIAQKYPGHPAAARANELVASLQPTPKDPDAPSKLARGEIAFWSTIGGVSIGANVCQLVECQSDRAYAAVYMLSVGGSLGASLALTRHGIRQGEAQLYNSAQTWGSWNGLAINDGFAETPAEAGTALASHAAGLGLGIALWQTWRPAEGDVALTNTFWVWSSVLTVWAHLATDSDLTLRRVVVAGDVGLVAGALISTQVKVSRGRTLLIDVGGVLGLLAGGLIAVGTNSDEAAGTALLLGTGAGLGVSVLFTKDWDAPKVPVSPAPIAGPQSTGVGLMSGFAF